MQTTKQFSVVILAVMLMTFMTAGAVVPFAFNEIEAQKDKAEKEKKEKEKKAKEKTKKPKAVQNVKITANVDASQVENATDALSSYSFTVQSGTFVSKPKTIDSIDANATSAVLNFNGKLGVSVGDGFSITGISDNDQYQTVVGSGTFTSEPQGKSGKSTIVGSLSEDLILTESAVEGLE